MEKTMADAYEVWSCFPLAGAQWRKADWSFDVRIAMNAARNLRRMGCFTSITKTRKPIE